MTDIEQKTTFDYFLCMKKGEMICEAFRDPNAGQDNDEIAFANEIDMEDSFHADSNSEDSNRESAEQNDYPDEEIYYSDKSNSDDCGDRDNEYSSEDDEDKAAVRHRARHETKGQA